ncbi:MAG TPA: response regulator transcription factor, partial [Nannocystis sp.]
LRRLLEGELDIEVIGEAEDGRAAVRLAIELAPDVVVMDISMPLLDGVEATRQIVEYNPSTRVVALSGHADQEAMAEVLRAGASAYLSKAAAYDELARAIRVAMAEQRYLGASLGGLALPPVEP